MSLNSKSSAAQACQHSYTANFLSFISRADSLSCFQDSSDGWHGCNSRPERVGWRGILACCTWCCALMFWGVWVASKGTGKTREKYLFDGVPTLVDKGKITDVIYLDSCKAFDTVSHNILFPQRGGVDLMMERGGFNDGKWLDSCIQWWSTTQSPDGQQWQVVSLRGPRWHQWY